MDNTHEDHTLMIHNHYTKLKEQEEHNLTRGTLVDNYTANSNIVLQLLVALTHNNLHEVFSSTNHALTESKPLVQTEIFASTDHVLTYL